MSTAEAVESCIAAIEQCDGEIGAFRVTRFAAARAEAREADARVARGEPAGPLHGMTLAVKELFDVAGVETTAGAAMLAGRVPRRDAEAVRRARAAGAVVIGTTRSHEFAWGYAMVGPDGEPVTRNPRDTARMPGGSSGGSAAAVAAGMASLALGTDTGGSIRLPAAWCGVTGFKPTHGLVPMDGVWPLAPSLDHAGPLACTPQDCALLLHALGGPPPEALTRAVRAAGPEALPAPARIEATYMAIFGREALATHRRAGLWPRRAAEYSPAMRDRLAVAGAVDDATHEEARRERGRMRAEMAAVFAEFDVIVSPVAAIGPPRFDDRVDLRPHVTPHLALQDLLGLPACALADGRQVTGPPGADALVLAYAAEAASSASPWSRVTTGA